MGRDAPPGRKLRVTGGMQTDLGRVKGEARQGNTSSLLPHAWHALSCAQLRLLVMKTKVLRRKHNSWYDIFKSPQSLYQPALSLAQDTTAASPMSQSKVMAFIGLRHFRETAPTPNKYKHRHLQLIMVLLISPISLQIVVEIDSGQVMNKLVVWKSDTCTQD